MCASDATAMLKEVEEEKKNISHECHLSCRVNYVVPYSMEFFPLVYLPHLITMADTVPAYGFRRVKMSHEISFKAKEEKTNTENV